MGYEQLVLNLNYNQVISPKLSFQYNLSKDLTSYERLDFDSSVQDIPISHLEEKLMLKGLGRWSPSKAHTLAFGLEWEKDSYGKKSPGWPNLKPTIFSYKENNLPTPSWKTKQQALLIEYQWQILENLNWFTGLRLYEHDYTKLQNSARTAFV